MEKQEYSYTELQSTASTSGWEWKLPPGYYIGNDEGFAKYLELKKLDPDLKCYDWRESYFNYSIICTPNKKPAELSREMSVTKPELGEVPDWEDLFLIFSSKEFEEETICVHVKRDSEQTKIFNMRLGDGVTDPFKRFDVSIHITYFTGCKVNVHYRTSEELQANITQGKYQNSGIKAICFLPDSHL